MNAGEAGCAEDAQRNKSNPSTNPMHTRNAHKELCSCAAGLAAAMALTACSGELPLLVKDARTRGAEPARVDVYAMPQEWRELRRQTITPVDEYFETQGRPTRPENVWVSRPTRETPATLTPQEAAYRKWDSPRALVAVAETPARTNTNAPDPRRRIFPCRKGAYPSGTKSLLLSVTDEGLKIEPTARRIDPPTP